MSNKEFKADCYTLFENLNEGVAVVNFRGEFQFFNSAACKILERSDNDLINTSIYDFVQADERVKESIEAQILKYSGKGAGMGKAARASESTGGAGKTGATAAKGTAGSVEPAGFVGTAGATEPDEPAEITEQENRVEFEFISERGKRKFLVLSFSPYYEAGALADTTADAQDAGDSAAAAPVDAASGTPAGSDTDVSATVKSASAGRGYQSVGYDRPAGRDKLPMGVSILISDITRQKNYEYEIRHRLDLEKLISEISSDFVHLEIKDIDSNIHKALMKVGKFAGVDRSYIFLFSKDKLSCDNTHEWCNHGIKSEIDNLKGIPVEAIPWWMSKLTKSESIHIPLVSALPPEAKNEKATLEEQGIQSLLVMPLNSAEDLIGFIGFDSVREVKSWNQKDISLLKILADVLGNAFSRMNSEEQIRELNSELEQKVEERTSEIKALLEFNRTIVENVDLIVFTTDNKGVIDFMNPYSFKRLGYSADEIIGKQTPLLFYFNNGNTETEWLPVEAGGGPVANIIGGEWKLKTKGGEIFDALVTVSSLENINGEVTGYAHVAIDITERKRNEYYSELQRDLGFTLAATTTIDEALNQVIDSTFKINGVGAVGIYLLNDKTEDLELVAHKGVSNFFADFSRCVPKASEKYEIIMQGAPLFGVYDDIIKESNPMFEGEGFKQIGVFPIKYEGRVIGAINMGSKSQEIISDKEKINIEIISSQIGGTLSRIKAENALNLSRENFKLMFDTIDDFLFILDANGNIIRTNPIVTNRLGFSDEELNGMNVLEVHPPLQREEALRIVNAMLAGTEETCPIPLYKKDGGEIPVETKVIAGKWDGEDALYGISRDISERVEAQKALAESEKRLNFALESTGDGVWDWNLEDNTLFYSPKWKAMLGYSDNEVGSGLDEWTNRVHPDDLPKAMSDLEKHISGETDVYVSEHRLRCKDGSFKWILDRGKVVEWDNSGKPVRVTGIHTDITLRKELEMLKSRFVSMASHEFRTPLASILLISDTLLSYYSKMSPQEQFDRLKRIKDHVQHLTNIVNDVLQLSRIQEGRVSFNPMPEDIIGLCSEISEQFGSVFLPENKIEFIHTGVEKLIATVDKTLFKRAMENLLSNAVKYSGKDPKIKIRLKVSPQEWVLEVEDNGIGIPQADRKHIFTPFFRAGNVSTIQGNGLGLSIIKEAVQIHKGWVSFESKTTSNTGGSAAGGSAALASGTTFSLHFPL